MKSEASTEVTDIWGAITAVLHLPVAFPLQQLSVCSQPEKHLAWITLVPEGTAGTYRWLPRRADAVVGIYRKFRPLRGKGDDASTRAEELDKWFEGVLEVAQRHGIVL